MPTRLSSVTITSITTPSLLPLTSLQETIPLNQIKISRNNSTDELYKNTND